MKQNILITSFFTGLLILLLASAAFSSAQKQVRVRVDGLSCPFCAYGLEKKLKSIDGVEKLAIKVNDGLAILTFKEGAKIDKEVIAKKVKEAGFTPGEIIIGTAQEQKMTNGEKITLNVQGMSCDGCVSRVTRALENIECVRDVNVDLKDGKATFTCTDKNHDRSKFVEVVKDLGFKAELEKK